MGYVPKPPLNLFDFESNIADFWELNVLAFI
jgi:hypothetical protein